MHGKVLIPLDGSKEAEGVFRLVKDEMAPDGEAILLQVIPTRAKDEASGKQLIFRSKEDNTHHATAIEYLDTVAGRLLEEWPKVRVDTTVDDNVAQGISNYAKMHQVDLIAMYTHDRKGIAKLIQRSVAKGVVGRSSAKGKLDSLVKSLCRSN